MIYFSAWYLEVSDGFDSSWGELLDLPDDIVTVWPGIIAAWRFKLRGQMIW